MTRACPSGTVAALLEGPFLSARSHQRRCWWAFVVIQIGLVLSGSSETHARTPRRFRQQAGKIALALQRHTGDLVLNAVAPTEAHKALRWGGAQVGKAVKFGWSGAAGATLSGHLRGIRDGLEQAGSAADQRVARQLYEQVYSEFGALEAELQAKLKQGNVFSILMAAIRLLRAERMLRHAAEAAIHREGSTSASTLDVIEDELANPRLRRKLSQSRMNEILALVTKRSAKARAQRGALDIYKRIIEERVQGKRFDPWGRAAHGSTALAFVRLFHRVSVKNSVRSVNGLRLPYGWRPLSNTEYLADEGYSKMVEVSDELLDVFLMSLDSNYRGPDAATRARRLKRLQRAQVEEVLRLARNATQYLTKLYLETRALRKERKKEGGEAPEDIGAVFVDVGYMMLDRLEENVRAGRFKLTRAQKDKLAEARKLLRVSRRRQWHKDLGPGAIAHNALALFVRPKDQLGGYISGNWMKSLRYLVDAVTPVGLGTQTTRQGGKQQQQQRSIQSASGSSAF